MKIENRMYDEGMVLRNEDMILHDIEIFRKYLEKEAMIDLSSNTTKIMSSVVDTLVEELSSFRRENWTA